MQKIWQYSKLDRDLNVYVSQNRCGHWLRLGNLVENDIDYNQLIGHNKLLEEIPGSILEVIIETAFED